MSKYEDGGPAFPSSYATPYGSTPYDDNHGMSLRDWFAGQAIASGNIKLGASSEAAFDAYQIADAMLKARSAE
jgi:hypothetical protein